MADTVADACRFRTFWPVAEFEALPLAGRPPHAVKVPELGVYLDAGSLLLPTIRAALDGGVSTTPNPTEGISR